MNPRVRLLLRVLYWLAVLAVSVALVFALILLLESRDESDIEGNGGVMSAPFAPVERTR